MRKMIYGGVLACVTALPAWAQGYFEGKDMVYIIATNPGGGYDAYARLIGPYLEAELGADSLRFRNLPGAGHIVGANTLYAAEPDGLTIGTFNTGLIYGQLLDRSGITFDLEQFSWIGKAASDPRVLVLSAESDLQTFQDILDAEEPPIFAANGVGSANYTETQMLSEGLDLGLELVSGYGGNEGEMAMMRGEVDGTLGSRSSLAPFVDAGNGAFVLSIGGEGEPKAIDFAETDRARSIVNLIDALSSLGRLTAAPPGVDPAVLEELRNAYMAVMENPDFLAEAERIGRPIEPATGEAVAELIGSAMEQSPETIRIISAALNVEIPTISATSEILSLADGNKRITFNSGDETVTAEISGARTALTIDGETATRDALNVGMVCEIEYNPTSEVNEPVAMACTSG